MIENEPIQQRWIYIQNLVKDYKEGGIRFSLIPSGHQRPLGRLGAAAVAFKATLAF
jgi:hypothetical protein